MDRSEELKALARKCRDLAAGVGDEETRNSLELLARDYEASAAELEAALPPPRIPRPE